MYEWTAVVMAMVGIFTVTVTLLCCCWRCCGVDEKGAAAGDVELAEGGFSDAMEEVDEEAPAACRFVPYWGLAAWLML